MRRNFNSMVIAAALATPACATEYESTQHAHQEAPERLDVTELVHFESIDEMVATSDAVVRARVVATRAGIMVGDEEDRLQLREVVLADAEILYGNIERGGDHDTILLEEIEWPQELGVPEDVLRLDIGEEAIFFLWRKRDRAEPVYRLVNRQGVYPITGEETLAITSRHDALIADLEALPISELNRDIARIEHLVSEGEMTPVQLPLIVLP